MREAKKRSVAKAISFRAIATLVTMTIIYFITGSLSFAGAIGAFDVIIKLIIYYYHERLWEKLTWGRPKNTLNKYFEEYSEEL